MSKLIVISGLEGSGKFRLAKKLAESYSKINKISKWQLDWFRPAVQGNCLDIANKNDWYAFHSLSVLAMLEISERIKQEKDDDTIIVCNWIAEEATINELFSSNKDIQELGLNYNAYNIVDPEAVIYLKPSFDVRVSRIMQKEQEISFLDRLTINPQSEEIMQSYVSNFYDERKTHIIDNDQDFEVTLQQVEDIISCC